jgi:preprotein translocase subunit SecG
VSSTEYANIAQIMLAVALVAVLLFQVSGGGLGGIFGEPESVYRTRRGVAKTLFRVTVLLATAFIVLSLLRLRYWMA